MKHQLGKRIVIVGVSASGKTTFSRQLSIATGLPVVHMDALMWNPGWEYIGDDETCTVLRCEAENPAWIIEGYITTAARAGLFEAADTILYLDYAGPVAAWRYIKRWWQHRSVPRPELPGSPESFSWSFLWLVLTKGETRSLHTVLDAPSIRQKVVPLRSPKEAADFIKHV